MLNLGSDFSKCSSKRSHSQNQLKRLTINFHRDGKFILILRITERKILCFRYFGSYQFLQPSLFVRDLELIKKITVKDFEYFPDHFLLFSNNNDPITGSNLFALKGEKWKDLRSTLSPAFTSSKMKSMFVLMSEIAEKYTANLAKNDKVIQEWEMKNLFSKYTNDIIATCAFGINCDSLTDPQNEFFRMGKLLTIVTWSVTIRGMFIGFFPKLCEVSKNHLSSKCNKSIHLNIHFRY